MRSRLALLLLLCSCADPAKDKQIQDLKQQIANLQNRYETESKEKAKKIEQLSSQLTECANKLKQPDTAVGAAVKSRMLDIERWLGERVLDNSGNFVDLPATLCHLQMKTAKKFNNNYEIVRRAAISDFGIALGTAILNACPETVDTLHAKVYSKQPPDIKPSLGRLVTVTGKAMTVELEALTLEGTAPAMLTCFVHAPKVKAGTEVKVRGTIVGALLGVQLKPCEIVP